YGYGRALFHFDSSVPTRPASLTIRFRADQPVETASTRTMSESTQVPSHPYSRPGLDSNRIRFGSGRTHTHPGVIRRFGRTARPPGLQPTLDRTVSARSVIILLGRPAVSNASGVGRLFGCSAYHLAAAGLGSGWTASRFQRPSERRFFRRRASAKPSLGSCPYPRAVTTSRPTKRS